MAAVIGWDVGGAHLKAARAEDGHIVDVVQLPCPLWQGLPKLSEALHLALPRLGAADRHAVTTTGELADLFADRAEGVATIAATLAEILAPSPVQFYAGSVGFRPAAEAPAHVAAIASANWHASAALLGRVLEDALLVDMGSTTTDVVPVARGRVAAAGNTDAERLACGELVYTGLTRSFVMALAPRAPFAGTWTTLANEYFASSADIYRVVDELPDCADQMPAADGREKTAAASRARLARMVGRDVSEAGPTAWRHLAAWFAEQQLRSIADAAAVVLSRGVLPDAAPVVGAGVGQHIAARLAARLERPFRDFSEVLADRVAMRGTWPTACAPAVAVALLAYDDAFA